MALNYDNLEKIATNFLDATESLEEFNGFSTTQTPSTPRNAMPPRASSTSSKRKHGCSTLQQQAAINRCIKALEECEEKDEFTIFGDFVASELRLMKNAPDLQGELKLEIQKKIIDVSQKYAERKKVSISQECDGTI